MPFYQNAIINIAVKILSFAMPIGIWHPKLPLMHHILKNNANTNTFYCKQLA
jgi:hypothetical protein